MSSKGNGDLSITVAAFYLKIVGFWQADSNIEKRWRKFATIYTLCALFIAVTVEVRDFYYTWGDFGKCIYITCNLASLGIGLLKMFISLVHKTDLLNLVMYAHKNFWYSDYDPHEQVIFDSCKRTCTFLICTFNFLSQTTVAFYVIKPVIENIGKNESERILPFNMWLDLPLSMTPYFEIGFIIQVLILYHVGVCYLCFDNFLCILSLHTATQFRILQYRLISSYGLIDHGKNYEITSEPNYDTDKYHRNFKNSIQQHQTLLKYCEQLERVFTLLVLGQMILFSMMICLDGYLVLMEDAPPTHRLTFLFHVTSCMVQLLMFTYSCDTLIRESTNVAGAAYGSLWTLLPMDKGGKMVRDDLTLVIMRSQSPCCLTAGGFFVVSLETYTTVLSTAVSYFTLLTQY